MDVSGERVEARDGSDAKTRQNDLLQLRQTLLEDVDLDQLVSVQRRAARADEGVLVQPDSVSQ